MENIQKIISFFREREEDDIEIYKEKKVELLELAQKEKEVYQKEYDKLVYHNQSLKKNTVSEFLYSCLQPSIALETECTPSCLNSLPNFRLNVCNKRVFTLEKNGIEEINNNKNKSNFGYFFIPSLPREFEITEEMIKYFFDKGIEEIIIYGRDGNNTDYIRGDRIILKEKVFNKKESDFSLINIVIIVIFSLVFIFLVSIFIWYKVSMKNVYKSYPYYKPKK